MRYKGHVQDGVIVIDEPTPLKEGDRVAIEAIASETVRSPSMAASRRELYKPLLGAVTMPEDWSTQTDGYLRNDLAQ